MSDFSYTRDSLIFSSNHPKPNNSIQKSMVLDFLLPENADWLDRSQAFIPYTAWFETGHKSIVDFPRDCLISFLNKDTFQFCRIFDIGNIYSFMLRSTDVYYHGSIISLRPLVWFFFRISNHNSLLFMKQSVLSFGVRRRYRKGKQFSSLGGSIYPVKGFQSRIRIKISSKFRKYRIYLKNLKEKRKITPHKALVRYFRKSSSVSNSYLKYRNVLLSKLIRNHFIILIHINRNSIIREQKSSTSQTVVANPQSNVNDRYRENSKQSHQGSQELSGVRFNERNKTSKKSNFFQSKLENKNAHNPSTKSYFKKKGSVDLTYSKSKQI